MQQSSIFRLPWLTRDVLFSPSDRDFVQETKNGGNLQIITYRKVIGFLMTKHSHLSYSCPPENALSVAKNEAHTGT